MLFEIYLHVKIYICVENLDLLDLFRNVQNPYHMQKYINNQIQIYYDVLKMKYIFIAVIVLMKILNNKKSI